MSDLTLTADEYWQIREALEYNFERFGEDNKGRYMVLGNHCISLTPEQEAAFRKLLGQTNDPV